MHKTPFMTIVLDSTRKNMRTVILMTLFLILAILSSLYMPMVLADIVDAISDAQSVSLTMAMLYFLVLACTGIFTALREAYITSYGQILSHALRSSLAEKLHTLPADYFVKHDPGETTSLFVNDVNTLEDLFSGGVISLISDVASLFGIVIVIFTKSIGLGILLIIALPLLFAMTRHFQKQMKAAQTSNREAIARESAMLPEALKNIRSIHIYHAEPFIEKRYGNAIRQSYSAMEKNNLYDAVYSPIIITVSSLIIAFLMSFSGMSGSFRTFFGISVGTAVALISYVNQVFDPLSSIGMEIQSIQSAMASVTRINAFFNETERTKAENKVTFDFDQPAVEINDLCFGYTEDHQIFDHFHLTVQSDEFVTFTGRTGAGKSTLFKLLLNLYSPTVGSVRIYGVDVKDIPESQFRSVFGYVEQKFTPVPGTIYDQIALYDTSIKEQDVIEALKEVGLYGVIDSFPEKLHTPCSPDLFSMGQWQLLSIARASVTKPRILLLDEITSNLDAETEQNVLQALEKAATDRTVLSISHRVYTSKNTRQVHI